MYRNNTAVQFDACTFIIVLRDYVIPAQRVVGKRNIPVGVFAKKKMLTLISNVDCASILTPSTIFIYKIKNESTAPL